MNSKSNHTRFDKLTGQWVVYASEYKGDVQLKRTGKIHRHSAEACRFCPQGGIESEVISQKAADDDVGWSLRVVPDICRSQQQTRQFREGPYTAASNFSRTEYIIENPLHSLRLVSMSLTQLADVAAAYADRAWAMYDEQPQIESVLIYRKQRYDSARAFAHPHSQVLGFTCMPHFLQVQEKNAHDYYNENSRCLLCDIVKYEQLSSRGTFYQNSSFISLVPFAAVTPFEIWIVPKVHAADIYTINDIQAAHFAQALSFSLKALCKAAKNPDYSSILYTASRTAQKSAFCHWIYKIKPQARRQNDFEYCSGMHVNSSVPENDARLLRAAVSTLLGGT